MDDRSADEWTWRAQLPRSYRLSHVFLLFAGRELKLRYKQTVLGVAWTLLQPLAAMAVFALVFGRLAGLPSDGIPYVPFVYAGLMLWTYLTGTVEAAGRSLVQDRELLTKSYFPRVLGPAAPIVAGLVDLVLLLPVLGVLVAAFGIQLSPALLLAPLCVVATVVIAFATGLLFAALNVQFRHVKYALPFLLQLWLYASAVVYPVSLFEGTWRLAYGLNPMVGVLSSFRWSVLGGPLPGVEVAASAVSAAVILTLSLGYVARVERRFADVG